MHPWVAVPISVSNLILVLLRSANPSARRSMVHPSNSDCGTEGTRYSERFKDRVDHRSPMRPSNNLPRLYSACSNTRDMLRLRIGTRTGINSVRIIHHHLQI